MFSAIYNWFKNLFVKAPEPDVDTELVELDDARGYISYKIDGDNTVRLSCNLVHGAEDSFAELLFNINSGALLGDTLEIINSQAKKSGTNDSCQKMITCLTTLYQEEALAREEEEKAYMDESIINPSDVFNSNNNEEE